MQNLHDLRKYPDDRMRTERTCDCESCLEEMWERMTEGGVQFRVYDLLPVRRPEDFRLHGLFDYRSMAPMIREVIVASH